VATVGFVGLGHMGGAMVARLLERGHEVLAYDHDAQALQAAAALGATAVEGPGAAAMGGIVCTSLPGPVEIEAVVCGPGGILEAPPAGLVHVELSTSSLAAVTRLAAREAAAGVRYLDAPVSGGAVAARAGSLAVMAAGDPEAVSAAGAVLDALAASVFDLGPTPGAGTVAKLVNNAIFLSAGLLAQEGVVLAQRAGLDVARLVEVLGASSSSMYTGMLRPTLARRFQDAFFTLDLAEKDLALALETARGLGTPMPVTSAAHQTYLRAVAAGLGQQVFFATLAAVESAAGVEVPEVAIPGAAGSGPAGSGAANRPPAGGTGT